MKKLTRHHILPRSKGGNSKEDNIKMVDKKKHEAYHILFTNALPEEAIMILINEWFYKDPNKRNKALYKLTMELAKITSNYINQLKIDGFRAGAGV